MFKYEKKTPIECKVIDFQLAQYAPPAMDLVTFIYSSSTREFRNMHMNEILKKFCDVFENELKALLRSEILQSFEEFKIAGLIEATIFAHLVLPPELAYKTMESSDEYEKFFSQCRENICIRAFEFEYYRDRVSELLIELIDEFILKDTNV